jgi:hypothetical protein
MNPRAIAAILAAWLSLPAPAADFTLTYLGQQIVPTGMQFDGTTVGGLSSLDYVAATDRYLAISDDRSDTDPARFYELTLDLSRFRRSNAPGMTGVAFRKVTTIQRSAGGRFAARTVDPEGLRYDARRNTIYWCNEGQRGNAGFQNPTVREMNPDGSHVRDFAVPAYYRPSGSGAGRAAGDLGVRDNLGFESLALSSDGNTLYAATENGLAQDGPAASPTEGSRVRILSFDPATGRPAAEFAYDVDPVAVAPAVPFLPATNGLTDFVAIGERRFITIERSFTTGAGVTIRLYLADARGATDLSGRTSIAGQDIQAVRKSLLLDLSTLRNDDDSPLVLDNIEGITFGPARNGRKTLILVSDNNFSVTQFTQFIAFELAPAE